MNSEKTKLFRLLSIPIEKTVGRGNDSIEIRHSQSEGELGSIYIDTESLFSYLNHHDELETFVFKFLEYSGRFERIIDLLYQLITGRQGMIKTNVVEQSYDGGEEDEEEEGEEDEDTMTSITIPLDVLQISQRIDKQQVVKDENVEEDSVGEGHIEVIEFVPEKQSSNISQPLFGDIQKRLNDTLETIDKPKEQDDDDDKISVKSEEVNCLVQSALIGSMEQTNDKSEQKDLVLSILMDQ